MSLDDLVNRYSDVSKPDDKTPSPPAKDAAYLIMDSFRKWASIVQNIEVGLVASDRRLDDLFEEAKQILAPSEASLPDIISDETYFLPIMLFLGKIHQQYAGLFYSALLTRERTLIVPKHFNSSHWGYKMAKGKIVLYSNSKGGVGFNASGGTIINYGNITNDYCDKCIGGLFVNYGICGSMGWGADNGIFINMGFGERIGGWAENSILINMNISGSMAYNAINSLFVNYGKISEFGAESRNCTLVTTTPWHGPFLQYAIESVGITPKELTDKNLVYLLSMLKESAQNHDVEQIKRVSKEIGDITKTTEKAVPYHMQSHLNQFWQLAKGFFIAVYWNRT